MSALGHKQTFCDTFWPTQTIDVSRTDRIDTLSEYNGNRMGWLLQHPFGLLRTRCSRPDDRCRTSDAFDEIPSSHRLPPKAQDRASYSVKRADWKGDATTADVRFGS
jgi:hypothetical protein